MDKLAKLPFDGDVVATGNIGPETVWAPALEGVDAVVHLAGRAHVLKETSQDPLAEFRRINVLGTECLARAAADEGVRRLIYVSSIGVNGRVTYSQPFTEEDVPTPHNSYAISKWEAEQVLHRVAEETGIEVVILRPPLIYGPGVKANFLRLMKLVNQGLPLPLASVRNRRSFLYVGNLADAVVRCLEYPEVASEVFLISDGEDVSTPELLRCIAGSLHCPARFVPLPPTLLRAAGHLTGRSSMVEPLLDSLVMDCGKIQRVLGWQPPYSLAEGVGDMARWFKAGRPVA